MSARNAGDLGLIPESGRSPGEGNGNPLQYACLENSMDGGAWEAIVHGGCKELDMIGQLHWFTGPVGAPSGWLLCPWSSPGKRTGVGCHFLLQEIFLTQGLNPGLLRCRQMLYHLSHQGSQIVL